MYQELNHSKETNIITYDNNKITDLFVNTNLSVKDYMNGNMKQKAIFYLCKAYEIISKTHSIHSDFVKSLEHLCAQTKHEFQQ